MELKILLNNYHYDEVNKLLVTEHVGHYEPAELQNCLLEIFAKMTGRVETIIAVWSELSSASTGDSDLALVDFNRRKMIEYGADLDNIILYVVIPRDAPESVDNRYKLMCGKTRGTKVVRIISWEAALAEAGINGSLPFSF
jgi:hypothetical protein